MTCAALCDCLLPFLSKTFWPISLLISIIDVSLTGNIGIGLLLCSLCDAKIIRCTHKVIFTYIITFIILAHLWF